jgi:hypothetical protein
VRQNLLGNAAAATNDRARAPGLRHSGARCRFRGIVRRRALTVAFHHDHFATHNRCLGCAGITGQLSVGDLGLHDDALVLIVAEALPITRGPILALAFFEIPVGKRITTSRYAHPQTDTLRAEGRRHRGEHRRRSQIGAGRRFISLL